MKVVIHPSSISGNIKAPASKSVMQRACAAALIREGETTIRNQGISKDDLATLSVIQKLGATVQQSEGFLTITSNGVFPISDEINCGESGLCVRMFTPIAALSELPITINGEGSLLQRSMRMFDEIMPKLSVNIESNAGRLPMKIKGPLNVIDIEIDGSSSSQFLTGLLMAYSSLNLNETKTITVHNLASKPYIDLTISVIESFGLNVPVNHNYQSFTFEPYYSSNNNNDPIEYVVEGDWSGAAFLLVAAAIAGKIELNGIFYSSKQADRAILEVLKSCGANVVTNENQIKVISSELNAFEFDATDCPDLFPPLVALAAYCKGKSVIKGVNRLSDKESNRGLTLQTEFLKFGIEIIIDEDKMIVHGGSEIKGAEVHSHNDHRIAMACAVTALGAKEKVIIIESECIEKSYPGFFKDLISIGASIQFQ